MNTLARRTTLAAGAVATCAALALTTSQSASAATVFTINYDVSATTTIAKMGTSVTTTGTDTTSLTLETRTLTSDMQLNPVTTPAASLLGMPVAYATVAVEPTASATGTLDDTGGLHITQSAYLHITKLTGPDQTFNLVGSNCRTSTPVTMNLTGKLASPVVNLTGTFDIPQFSGCGWFGLFDSLVSSKMSGPGNTVAITLTQKA